MGCSSCTDLYRSNFAFDFCRALETVHNIELHRTSRTSSNRISGQARNNFAFRQHTLVRRILSQFRSFTGNDCSDAFWLANGSLMETGRLGADALKNKFTTSYPNTDKCIEWLPLARRCLTRCHLTLSIKYVWSFPFSWILYSQSISTSTSACNFSSSAHVIDRSEFLALHPGF